MRTSSIVLSLAAAAAVVATAPSPAEARCTRLAFSVNDYGKDGPTRDAKQLLDRYIADWTSKQGIKQYTVGKRDVSCELFLDFGVFDEHTCKASALVCWGGTAGPKAAIAPPGGAQAAAGDASGAAAKAKAAPAVPAPKAPAAAAPKAAVPPAPKAAPAAPQAK